MTDAPLLEVQDVTREFSVRHGTVRAVDGVSASIGRNEVVGLVGESGSGKSTLGRLALGIQDPTSGRVVYDGTDLTQLPPRAIRPMRRHFQMIFQDPVAALNPRMRVSDLVAEPMMELTARRRAACRDRVYELLELVQLDPALADRYPRELSGGQAQRVGIARALSVDPEMIVADEPVSALDASVATKIAALLSTLRERHGVAILFISHDLSVVRAICDRVLVMYLGRVVESGPTEEIFSAPRHPYTAALLSATPSVTRHLTRRAPRILLTGELPDPADIPEGCRFASRCPIGPLHRDDRALCRDADPTLAKAGGTREVACHFSADVDQLGVTAPASMDGSSHGNAREAS